MLYSYQGVIWVSDGVRFLMRDTNLSLTNTSIQKILRDCKHEQKRVRVKDRGQQHLYLFGEKSGNGRWVIRAEGSGRSREDIVVGKYPDVPQKEARAVTSSVVSLFRAGFTKSRIEQELAKTRDPIILDGLVKGSAIVAENSDLMLEDWIERWYADKYEGGNYSPRHKPIAPLRRYVFPVLGKRPLADVTPQEIKDLLTPMWKRKGQRGKGLAGHETASRIRLYLDNAFEDALDLGLIDRNPVPAAKRMPRFTPSVEHHQSLDFDYIPEFWRWLNETCGADIRTKTGIALCLFLGKRSKEIRYLKWKYIDFDKQTFNAPGRFHNPFSAEANKEEHYSKNGDAHVQPIPDQLIKILRKTYELYGHQEWALSLSDKPMSDNTMRKVCKSFVPQSPPEDFKPFVPHGLRTTINSWMVRQHVPFEVKETILQHRLPSLQDAYYEESNLELRRKYLQQFADAVTVD